MRQRRSSEKTKGGAQERQIKNNTTLTSNVEAAACLFFCLVSAMFEVQPLFVPLAKVLAKSAASKNHNVIHPLIIVAPYLYI